tara:strand:+ start:247 stop:1143 length:897 start_codon:yes stop_codon:yes gene_type:complete
MSKKLDSILKKLESEKNQQKIKKFNITLSILALFFVARLYSEFNLTNLKITNRFTLAVLVQVVVLFISYKIWKNFLINNNVEINSSYLDNWSQANINKYIPGGIGLSITRFSIAKNLSIDSKKLFFGMIEDQLKGILIVFPFIIASFILVSELQKNYFYFFSIALTLYIISKLSNQYSKRLNFNSLFSKNFIFIFLSNIMQVGVNFLVLSTLLDTTYVQLIYISILYCVSASLSLIFIGSPAGLGIREFIFYIYSTNLLTNEIMLSYLFLIRIISVVTDVSFYLLSKLLIKIDKKNYF